MFATKRGRTRARLTVTLWNLFRFVEDASMSRFPLTYPITLAAAVLFASVAAPSLRAQSCAEPDGSQFSVTTVVGTGGTLKESGSYGVVGMSITKSGLIFIAKMKSGEIQVYDPAIPNTTSLAGTISTYASTEDGLLGVVADRNFESNGWIYAFYSDPCGLNCSNRAMELARFTYSPSAASNARLTNKKVILRFPRAVDDDHHAAGNLSMAANGMLVIGVGDNTDPHDATNNGYGPINYNRPAGDAQRTASNTNDLRGKILRITPIAFPDNQTPAAGEGSTYTIPAGNLWEYIDKPSFNPNWNSSVDDVSKVRKEIYSMGHRNPYHPRIDDKSGWVFFGEIGPDANSISATRGPSGHDEWNLVTGPGNFGHPYCNGYNVPYNRITGYSGSTAQYGTVYDCAALQNTSPNNTGITDLPPAKPALAAYTSGSGTDDDPRFNAAYSTTTISHASETAIGGPMYRYDPNLVSSGKFPPFYEGKIFFFDWSRRNFRVIRINPDGTIPAGAAGVTNFAPSGFPQASYIDMQFGPDGALYALRNSSNGYSGGDGNLVRIAYTGPIVDSCYHPFVATVGTPVSIRGAGPVRRFVAPTLVDGIVNLPAGYRSVELYDLSGRRVWSYHRASADEAGSVKIPAGMARGVLQARLVP